MECRCLQLKRRRHICSKADVRKLKTTLKTSICSSQQDLLASLLHGVLLCRCPDGKAECNLVHKVSQVVDQVQSAVCNTTHEVSEEVAKRVDGPTHRDNEAHGAERGLHVLADASSCNLASLTCKDLEQDKAPTSHAKNEASHWRHSLSLTCIAEGKHSNSAKQQTPEHALRKIRLHCRQDQVELNHLQRHGDGPINVAVQDGRG